jgi:hypothetical protein
MMTYAINYLIGKLVDGFMWFYTEVLVPIAEFFTNFDINWDSIGTDIKDAATWLGTKFLDGLEWVVTELPEIIVNGLSSLITMIADAIKNALSAITSPLGDVGDYLSNVGTDALTGGASGGWGGVAANILTGGASSFLPDSWTPWHNGGVIPRYHSGTLAPDEQLAILQAGEGIIKRSSMDKLGYENFNMLNQGMSIDDIARYSGNKYVDYSAGLPAATVNNDNSTTNIDEGDYYEGDINLTFENCTFTSEDAANDVERDLVSKFKNRRGELQRIIRGDIDNKTDKLRR